MIDVPFAAVLPIAIIQLARAGEGDPERLCVGALTSQVRTLSVVPHWLHMNATRPGLSPNGAISATFDIERPHHLQAFSDTRFIFVLPLS